MKQVLRMLILLLVRLAGLPGARAAARQARAPLTGGPRILLVRPDHLGDLVLTTPVLHALKAQMPDAHVAMMVGPWSSEVVARHPAIDRLLTCPFPGFRRGKQGLIAPYILLVSIAQQLRRGKYDLAINLRPDFWWGAALLYLARIPRRVGYAIEPGTPFLTHALLFPAPEHATRSALRLTSAGLVTVGAPPLEEPYTPERYPLQFVPTPEEQRWVAERLAGASIGAETPVVVIHPGSGAAVKLWRPEAWSECADALATSSTMRIVLTGGKGEPVLLEEIAGGMTAEALLVTDATVGQLAALLQRARLVLGVDSGPLHLAVAQTTPTVEIFGPSDPRIFGPWGAAERHIVVQARHRCPTCPAIPCNRLDIPAAEVAAHPCVRLVAAQEVLEAAGRLGSARHVVQ